MDDCIYARFFGPKWAKMAIFDVFDPFLGLNMGSITKNDKIIIMWDKYLDALGNSREKKFPHHFVCLPPMGPYASYVKHIYLPILPKWQHFKMKLPNFKNFSTFSKFRI